MLTGSLFNIIQNAKKTESEYNISFSCNPNHPIFEGHFPGEPILPGVCMVQFVRESLEIILNQKLNLNSAKTIKFIHIIDPRKEQILILEIKTNKTVDGLIETKAIIKNETTVFFQMRGVYTLNGHNLRFLNKWH